MVGIPCPGYCLYQNVIRTASCAPQNVPFVSQLCEHSGLVKPKPIEFAMTIGPPWRALACMTKSLFLGNLVISFITEELVRQNCPQIGSVQEFATTGFLSNYVLEIGLFARGTEYLRTTGRQTCESAPCLLPRLTSLWTLAQYWTQVLLSLRISLRLT